MAKRKTLDPDGHWRPKRLKVEFTDEKLTASSGLGAMVDAFVDSPQYLGLKECVPHYQSNAAYDPMQFVLPLLASFWYGYDCLEDVEKLENKPDLQHIFEGIPLARAIGDFLRACDDEHFLMVSEFLVKQSLAARRALAPDAPIRSTWMPRLTCNRD